MNKTYRIICNALLLTFLIISGKVSFSFGVISFTLQLLIVFIIAFLCNIKDGIFIISTYLLLGFVGLPIFNNGGGISYIYQPTFGFLLGFVFLILIINFLKLLLNKFCKKEYLIFLISGLFGLLIDYLIGSLYAYNLFINQYSFFTTLQLVLLPFIGLDILKLLLSIFISLKLKKYINKK